MASLLARRAWTWSGGYEYGIIADGPPGLHSRDPRLVQEVLEGGRRPGRGASPVGSRPLRRLMFTAMAVSEDVLQMGLGLSPVAAAAHARAPRVSR